MISLLRKLTWWVQRRRKEDEFREELQFHLDEEAIRTLRRSPSFTAISVL